MHELSVFSDFSPKNIYFFKLKPVCASDVPTWQKAMIIEAEKYTNFCWFLEFLLNFENLSFFPNNKFFLNHSMQQFLNLDVNINLYISKFMESEFSKIILLLHFNNIFNNHLNKNNYIIKIKYE